MLNILVVTDSPDYALLYGQFVQSKGAKAVSILSITEAILFLNSNGKMFDAIILDSHLNDKGGIRLLPIIHSNQPDAAVIMASASDDPELYVKASIAGIDDFIIKPVNLELLWLKLEKSVYQNELQLFNKDQQVKLKNLLAEQQQEQNAALQVFQTMFQQMNMPSRAIDQWIQSSSILSGDCILHCQGSDGSWYLILADAMGHGLAAATSLMPIMQTFSTMAQKSLPLVNIVFELNEKLCSQLPDDRFVAAVLVRIKPTQQEVEVWNGAMPSVLMISKDGREVGRASSKHMALGILEGFEFSVKMQVFGLNDIEHFVLLSDGVLETELVDLKVLSLARIPEVFKASDISPMDKLKGYFLNEQVVAEDDISICIVNCPDLITESYESKNKPISQPLTIGCGFKFSGASIRLTDVPGQVIELLKMQSVGMPMVAATYAIINELYNNAVEHGLLGLESVIKETDGGFMRYYEMRTQGLLKLSNDDFVILELKWDIQTNQLEILMEDSGPGFQIGITNRDEKLKYYGRGLELIKQLACSFEIISPGNKFRVLIQDHSSYD
ncbi:SpoIIE family protein phosphatase [Reinekea sp.]|jgi:DNA-binding response OmpR family regulator/anti-sigma regulatory factor (Ser/Thr protein kinase)|uniref:SpoIIE family protein phosphatase n=1 Tax=Reinekea sp. TaxID=1970455 RepID=UPI002A8208BE|nr:SpoIIE family protein phosphatase [Reinekea sp.]